jgi:hypothetical protein
MGIKGTALTFTVIFSSPGLSTRELGEASFIYQILPPPVRKTLRQGGGG